MALTSSTMLELGSPAPDFSLLNVDNLTISLDHFRDAEGLIVAFICNHCPYVKHIRLSMAEFAREYKRKDIAFVAINANDSGAYPEDSPAKMIEEVAHAGYEFPYLYDFTQNVAKAYHAACTPDFFLFDKNRKLFYRGQFDKSRPGNEHPVDGACLRDACDRLLEGNPPPEKQRPSTGCNIKWKPGNEPNYF